MNLDKVKSRIYNALLDTRIQIQEDVFEKDELGYKWVLSLHNIDVQVGEESVTTLLHTKIYVNLENNRKALRENAFFYLYDINCQYRKAEFDDLNELRDRVKQIIIQNDFGEDLLLLSAFSNEAPASSMNEYFAMNGIDDITVTNIFYNPKNKITPCDSTTFDFDISLNQGEREFSFSIYKELSGFSIIYYIGTDIKHKNISTLENLTAQIADQITTLF